MHRLTKQVTLLPSCDYAAVGAPETGRYDGKRVEFPEPPCESWLRADPENNIENRSCVVTLSSSLRSKAFFSVTDIGTFIVRTPEVRGDRALRTNGPAASRDRNVAVTGSDCLEISPCAHLAL